MSMLSSMPHTWDETHRQTHGFCYENKDYNRMWNTSIVEVTKSNTASEKRYKEHPHQEKLIFVTESWAGKVWPDIQ